MQQGGMPGMPNQPQLDPTIYQYFQIADQDRSGRIDFRELSMALKNDQTSNFSPEACRMMISMFDQQGDHKIDAPEFERIWKFLGQWRQAFNSYDQDRSGKIDKNELSQALSTMGYRFSPQFVEKAMWKFDIDMKRNLNFDEFVRLCCVLQSLTGQFQRYDTNRTGNIQVQYEQFMDMVFSSSM